MKTFIENYKIVPVGVDIDFATAASNLSDSINMKNYHSATQSHFIVMDARA